MQNLQSSQAYIFLILQRFATKLFNFTNFRMLFNAVVINFPISTFFKILPIMQSVHWSQVQIVITHPKGDPKKFFCSLHYAGLRVCQVSIFTVVFTTLVSCVTSLYFYCSFHYVGFVCDKFIFLL